MKSTCLPLTVLFFSVLCRFAVAGETAELPGTTVEIPWKGFASLLYRSPDTVCIDRGVRVPTPLVFENTSMAIMLSDSSATIDMDIGYSVLDTSEWTAARVFEDGNGPPCTGIRMPSGDLCRSTADSGIVVLARPGKAATRSREMRLQWIAAAETEAGTRVITIPVPRASRGKLIIEAPHSYTGIAVGGGVLFSQERRGGFIRYGYTLPPGGVSVTLRYVPPAPVAAREGAVERKIKRDPLVTAVQETGLFLADETIFCLTALTLTVTQSPLTRFTVTLPDGFSLLGIEGNGIGRWSPEDAKTIAVTLRFELAGDYVVYITGEFRRDSIIAVPSFGVKGALRQSGRFAFTATGDIEARALSLNNVAGMSSGEFVKESSPAFLAKYAGYGKGSNEIVFTGRYSKTPFDARVKTRRHAIVPVVNALADLGSLMTVIGAGRVSLTVVTFDIRQRNRQFVSLMLPDSAELWFVSVAGDAVTPLRGDDGYYKISLQRYMNSGSGDSAVPLKVTYLEHHTRAGTPTEFALRSPGIDIPVGKLAWTVYYPEIWRVKKLSGDFLASRPAIASFSTHGRDGSAKDLGDLQEQVERRGQNAAVGNAKLVGLLSEKSKCLRAYTILVVNERPVLNIRFGKGRAAVWMLVLAVLCIASAGGGIAMAIKRRGR